MGRIKTALVKRTAKQIFELHNDEVSEDFDKNKQVVAKYITVSKKLRNVIAGYLVRLKKQEKQEKKE